MSSNVLWKEVMAYALSLDMQYEVSLSKPYYHYPDKEEA